MRLLPLLAAITLTASACAPQAPPAAPSMTPAPFPFDASVENLAPELEPIRTQFGLPAIGAAVFRGHQLVAIGATGTRRIDRAEPVTVEDRWHLGSDTKAMTAMLVAMAIDRGQLRFEDRLDHFFSGIDPGYASVTVEQLLQHRGGLPAVPSPAIWKRAWRDGGDPAGRSHFVQATLASPPAQPPGTFTYSNASFITLGLLLERVTGRRWEELIQTDLFAPLGMSRCGFGAPTIDAPWGHHKPRDGYEPVEPGPDADNPPMLGPAGTVHCTLRDWGAFATFVLDAYRGDAKLVSAATAKRLLTPPASETPEGSYAGGWNFVQRGWAHGTALTHTGSNTLWYADAWLAPEKNLVFLIVENRAAPKAADTAATMLVKEFAK